MHPTELYSYILLSLPTLFQANTFHDHCNPTQSLGKEDELIEICDRAYIEAFQSLTSYPFKSFIANTFPIIQHGESE